MHFDYGSLLNTCSANSSGESGIGFKHWSFAVLSVQYEQRQMVYLFLCPIPNYVGVWTCLFWLTCQPLLLKTMVQDLEDMKVSVRDQHHAKLQESCTGQNIPFSFNQGYLILGMCYLLCDLTFCIVFFYLLCFTES